MLEDINVRILNPYAFKDDFDYTKHSYVTNSESLEAIQQKEEYMKNTKIIVDPVELVAVEVSADSTQEVEVLEAVEVSDAAFMESAKDVRDTLIAQNKSMDNEIAYSQASINEFVGMLRTQAMNEKFNKVLRTINFKKLKENKEFRQVQIVDDKGELVGVKTWQEFCTAMGFSRAKIDEDILNLNVFGAEFMEATERMGLGYRELKRLRNGVKDISSGMDSEELKQLEEAKGKSPEELREFIEDMSDRVKNLEADVMAKSDVVTKHSKRINQLEEEKSKAEKAARNVLDAAYEGGDEGIQMLLSTLERCTSSNLSKIAELLRIIQEIFETEELKTENRTRANRSLESFYTNMVDLLQTAKSDIDFVGVIDNMGFLNAPMSSSIGNETE